MNPVSISYDGEISIIKISNPPVNAISLEVRNGLLNAVNELEKKEEVKAVIICAPDRTFLAGADFREFGKNLEGPTLSEICNKIEKVMTKIQAFEQFLTHSTSSISAIPFLFNLLKKYSVCSL